MGGALGAYGTKPDEIQLGIINPLDSANQALDIGLSTLPKARQLTSAVNTYNQSELDKLLEMALPGGSNLIKQNLMAGLRGELPPDVVQQITRSVAEYSPGGASGSGYGSFKRASDIGLNSLKYISDTFTATQRWLAQSTAPLMDVSRSFFTPQQLLGFNVNERNLKYEADRVNAGIRAAPDPNMAQLAQGFDNFFKTWASVGMASMGSMGGTATSPTPAGGTGGADPGTNSPRGDWNFGGSQYA